MSDTIALIGLVVATAALLVGMFPVRSYVLERFFPYDIRVVESNRRDLSPVQYRLWIRLRNRTSRTAHFEIGLEGAETDPPNFPDWTLTEVVTGTSVNRADIPVGPSEFDEWSLFLVFNRPLGRPVSLVLSERKPVSLTLEGTQQPSRRFTHVLQPLGNSEILGK